MINFDLRPLTNFDVKKLLSKRLHYKVETAHYFKVTKIGLLYYNTMGQVAADIATKGAAGAGAGGGVGGGIGAAAGGIPTAGIGAVPGAAIGAAVGGTIGAIGGGTVGVVTGIQKTLHWKFKVTVANETKENLQFVEDGSYSPNGDWKLRSIAAGKSETWEWGGVHYGCSGVYQIGGGTDNPIRISLAFMIPVSSQSNIDISFNGNGKECYDGLKDDKVKEIQEKIYLLSARIQTNSQEATQEFVFKLSYV